MSTRNRSFVIIGATKRREVNESAGSWWTQAPREGFSDIAREQKERMNLSPLAMAVNWMHRNRECALEGNAKYRRSTSRAEQQSAGIVMQARRAEWGTE